ncbi:T9SS type A sorting domain-containing protein [Salinimicrobium oceani]|uniref:T9SS type A sorting domain-containing protein n=1 Tax=Salinimicrobium oceani TaxID=2722702 RepID=A0ABX1D4J3_9FLAO|nr:T9SS type A sorting domain-containing protein [Salinimicrobium oceani]NJW53471.1 T9SS type A sorting domain-containing protein [Salinimicrobium oceani]
MKKILLFVLTMGFFQLYSQENNSKCPIVENETQELCASEGTGNNYHLPMVLDLVATDTGGGIHWYETAESNDPLPEDHLLSDGASYFAGNAECNQRIEVVVKIFDAPNAGATTFIIFCNTDEPVDVLTLIRPSILGAPDAGGYFIPQFVSGTTEFDPSVDASGSYEYHVKSNNDVCPDDKAVIYITVNPTPNAGADRTIALNSKSPADLGEHLGEGVATNGKWNPSFASGTNVFDPQVDALGAYEYTVNSGACEDTTIITVVLNQQDPENCPTVFQSIQTFCESQGTGNNYYRPAIKHLVAESDDLAWYATADSEEALSWDEFLVDGRTYYAGDASNTCANRVPVTVKLLSSPNAGATTFLKFCRADEPVDVLTLMKPSILGAPDEGGYFVPQFTSGTSVFDPSLDVSGTYRYHVNSLNNSCPDDEAVVYITVNPTPNAGADRTIALNSQSPADLGEHLGEGVATNGKWNPTFASGTNVFNPQVDTLGNYEYTVTSGSCEDTAIITVVLNQQDPENCPTVAETLQSFCESEGTGNNYYRPAIKHLSAESNDLAWYPTADADQPLSWEEFLVDGITYYAGDGANTCANRVAVTVDLLTSPNAGATTFISVKSSDDAFDIVDFMKSSILGAPDSGGSVHPPLQSGNTIFNPAVDAGGQYKYTVTSSNQTCPDDSAYIYITVTTPNSNQDEVNMYPNPGNGVVNLSSTEDILSVRVLDLQGNVIRKFTRLENWKNLDLTDLNTAMYLMEITTPKGKVIKRLVKK